VERNNFTFLWDPQEENNSFGRMCGFWKTYLVLLVVIKRFIGSTESVFPSLEVKQTSGNSRRRKFWVPKLRLSYYYAIITDFH